MFISPIEISNKTNKFNYVTQEIDKYTLEEEFNLLLEDNTSSFLLEESSILNEVKLNKRLASFNNRFINRVIPIYKGLAGLAKNISDTMIKNTTDVNLQLKLIKKSIEDRELRRRYSYIDNAKYYISDDLKLEFPFPPLENVKKDLLTMNFPIWFVRSNSVSVMQDYLFEHTKAELKGGTYITAYKLIERMKDFLPRGIKRYKEINKMIEDTKDFIEKVKDTSFSAYQKYVDVKDKEDMDKKLDDLMDNIEFLTNSIATYHRAVSYLYIDSVTFMKELIQDIYNNLPDEAKTNDYYRS